MWYLTIIHNNRIFYLTTITNNTFITNYYITTNICTRADLAVFTYDTRGFYYAVGL